MITARPGALAALFCVATLSACVGPMTTREAQMRATDRITKYCNGRCGALRLSHSQRIKDRWLIDFEAPAQKFTVIVDSDGNSKIDIWNKPPG